MTKEKKALEALRDLRCASLAALLAYKAGMVLGDEYGMELQRAINQAKEVLE